MTSVSVKNKPRKHITRTLTEENIHYFNRSLEKFHLEKSRYFGVNLFRFHMKYIFDVFLSVHKEINPSTGQEFDFFPLQGNLDTGDPHGKPFPPFFNALLDKLSEQEEVKRYYGAAAQKALKDSISSFLLKMEVLENPKETMDYAIGSGTVHLYELICRQLIKRKGDAILIPTPTYGFFIPQVYRAGGIPILLETDDRGMIETRQFENTIKKYNERQLESWKKQFPNLIRLFESDLRTNWNIAIRESSIEDIKELENQLFFETTRKDWEKEVDAFIFSKILKNQEDRFSQIKEQQEIEFPYPPRVVGALFINPTVYGAVLTKEEVESLAQIMEYYHVTAIEDLAYLFIDVKPHKKQGYFLNYSAPYFSLLGVSKPFALSGMRLGMAISSKEKIEELQGRIENSIGFISPIFQKALIELFESPTNQIQEFFKKNNTHDEWGYSLKRKLSIYLLEGASTTKLSEKEKNPIRLIIFKEIKLLVKKWEDLGVSFSDTDLKKPFDRQHRVSLVDRFMEEGLSDFFDIVRDAEAGFFFILNCQKLINKGKIGPVKICCSFDVFALLSYFFGLKLFPSEAMGLQHGSNCNQLRYSFSSDVSLIVSLFFTAYLGIKQLEEIKNS